MSVLFIVIVLGTLALIFIPRPNVANAPTTSGIASTTPTGTSIKLQNTLVVVTAPKGNSTITSPLTIVGKARGSWYFEASAPVKLLDSKGSVIAHGTIAAQGDWMTTEFVPFTGTLTFTAQPAGSVGTLVLTNDNPSGDPAKQITLKIPVKF